MTDEHVTEDDRKVLRASNGAKLVQDGDQIVCMCPFFCMAAYELCEFSDDTFREVARAARG